MGHGFGRVECLDGAGWVYGCMNGHDAHCGAYLAYLRPTDQLCEPLA